MSEHKGGAATGQSGAPAEQQPQPATPSPTAAFEQQQQQPPVPGEPMTVSTRALQASAALLQPFGPIKQICNHVCAFHCYAHDASRLVHSHHMCSHLNEEVRQCVLYDSGDPGARLIGVEYMISRRLYEGLPEEEKKFWHSHIFEVSSGHLVAPGSLMPRAAMNTDMEWAINTYGKTFHFWQVDLGHPLPYGGCCGGRWGLAAAVFVAGRNYSTGNIEELMMAFTADGQVPEECVRLRDQQLGVDTASIKASRSHIKAEPLEPHPDADHPWRTGQAWQVQMVQGPFKPPPAPSSSSRTPASAALSSSPEAVPAAPGSAAVPPPRSGEAATPGGHDKGGRDRTPATEFAAAKPVVAAEEPAAAPPAKAH